MAAIPKVEPSCDVALEVITVDDVVIDKRCSIRSYAVVRMDKEISIVKIARKSTGSSSRKEARRDNPLGQVVVPRLYRPRSSRISLIDPRAI